VAAEEREVLLELPRLLGGERLIGRRVQIEVPTAADGAERGAPGVRAAGALGLARARGVGAAWALAAAVVAAPRAGVAAAAFAPGRFAAACVVASRVAAARVAAVRVVAATALAAARVASGPPARVASGAPACVASGAPAPLASGPLPARAVRARSSASAGGAGLGRTRAVGGALGVAHGARTFALTRGSVKAADDGQVPAASA
jgi:hypothetical protein